MNKELFYVFLPALSWCLFALGGTKINDKIPGWKGWRRFVLPAVYLIACLLAGVKILPAITVCIMTVAVYSLPYGDRTPWPVKLLVGCTYGVITFPLGFSWWNVFSAVGFIELFALSNMKKTADTFTWKICEGIFGMLVGIQLAYQLVRY